MIDLRETPYRWSWTDDHEAGARYDPYEVVLQGKRGIVYLVGKTMLGALVTSNWAKAAALAPGARVFAGGFAVKGDEMVVHFPPSSLPEIAGVLRLRKRPAFSDEQRAAAAARLRKRA